MNSRLKLFATHLDDSGALSPSSASVATTKGCGCVSGDEANQAALGGDLDQDPHASGACAEIVPVGACTSPKTTSYNTSDSSLRSGCVSTGSRQRPNPLPNKPLPIRISHHEASPSISSQEEPGRHEQESLGRFPAWLHRLMPKGNALFQTHQAVRTGRLQTVCEQARCPNLVECYSRKSATFLTMGHQCTRRCGFCSIDHQAQPAALSPEEPQQIAQAARELGLRHVVLTQVARDDLEDGGASHLVAIMEQLRKEISGCSIEVLTSDFQGRKESINRVMGAAPQVFNHNLETVKRLTPRVRHRATYERTLQVLKWAKEASLGASYIKSGLMVGLGESDEEIYEALVDLKACSVDIVTIGQYLQSSRHGLLVRRFVEPEIFDKYKEWGQSLGISHVYSAPFVRSSYNAHLFVEGGALGANSLDCQAPFSELSL